LKPPPGGSHEQARTQIILKTDERSAVLELDRDGEFAAKSNGWDENRVSGDKLEVAVKNGRWVLTRLPAGRGRRSSQYGTISITP
jgi:hypothetical protein